jgi:hypothetical protein
MQTRKWAELNTANFSANIVFTGNLPGDPQFAVPAPKTSFCGRGKYVLLRGKYVLLQG